MSTVARNKHVHFAGLTWKEEEARSSRGQSQRRTRKIRKKDQHLDKMNDLERKAAKKERQKKSAWDLLKRPVLAPVLVEVVTHSNENYALMLLRNFLRGMGLAVSNETSIEDALRDFRADDTQYDKLTYSQKQDLLNFWNEDAIHTFFFYTPGAGVSSTDSEDRRAQNSVFGTESWWEIQMPGLRERIATLTEDLLQAARAFSPALDHALNNAPPWGAAI